jgi:galactofuranose transport system permease protein
MKSPRSFPRLGGSAMQWLLLLLAIAATSLVSPSFLSLRWQDGRLIGGLVDVLLRGAPVALLATGMCLVIATRGVDLSVGAVMAIAGAVAAGLVSTGTPWPVAMIAALLAGLACGAWNGMLVAWFGIEPIVATLILMVAGRGLAQLISHGQIVTFNEPHLAWLGSGHLLGLPVPTLLLGGCLVLLALFCQRTAFGLFVQAVGVNPRASRLAGIRTQSVLMGVYMITGFLAAMAGVIAAADIRAADANNAGLWLELDAILAVVIGGGSLSGGPFSLSRTVLGALTLQTVKTGILRAGLPPEFNFVVMAIAVVLVLCLQSPAWTDAWTRIRAGRSAS